MRALGRLGRNGMETGGERVLAAWELGAVLGAGGPARWALCLGTEHPPQLPRSTFKKHFY